MIVDIKEKDDFGYGASVIICCYNSALRLPQTLQHLAKQVIPQNFFVEIILVDNASTDNTVETANKIWNEFEPKNITIKVINEPKPGQMFARKTGVRNAGFECIIFCDDDNWLCENYIFLAHQLISEDKTIGAAGGQNLPVTNVDGYPKWFEEYKDKYGLGIPAKNSGDVSYKTFVLGAGMATRKSLFYQIFDNRYPTLLNGRNGDKLSTGDDFEYCKRLLLWDYKLYYDENMILYHFIPKERLTLEYRKRLQSGIDEAGIILSEYDLAIRVHKKIKNKNNIRLFILSPFRILLTQMGLSKRVAVDEKLIFFYLAPILVRSNSVKGQIKKFIHHK
ncbi:MAG: glycosyltransferase family 2 protein [Bacteroidota bacterium]|nr:glycosyltransferase family 2 protein [Bacteroidota bacterium]